MARTGVGVALLLPQTASPGVQIYSLQLARVQVDTIQLDILQAAHVGATCQGQHQERGVEVPKVDCRRVDGGFAAWEGKLLHAALGAAGVGHERERDVELQVQEGAVPLRIVHLLLAVHCGVDGAHVVVVSHHQLSFHHLHRHKRLSGECVHRKHSISEGGAEPKRQRLAARLLLVGRAVSDAAVVAAQGEGRGDVTQSPSEAWVTATDVVVVWHRKLALQDGDADPVLTVIALQAAPKLYRTVLPTVGGSGGREL